ncbi:pentapeptide repeat-containing protein [Tolypothrix sp. NIES-4075]|uniref:pentapeptide repeat-containing protein n=1 Tax=Tolypothrix sp. NIES-4075 TaxID=2005459 RepID=UPI000B5CC2D2
MRGRNFSNADLGGANLRNTNLSGVDLSSAKLGVPKNQTKQDSLLLQRRASRTS